MPVRLPLRLLLPILAALALMAAPAAHALVPADMAELPYGSLLTGDCELHDQDAESHQYTWSIMRVQPRRIFAFAGTNLIPSPLPQRPEDVPETADGLYVLPVGMEAPAPDCHTFQLGLGMMNPATTHALQAVEPGWYWHYQKRSLVKFVWHSGGDQAPPPEPCGANDEHFPNPADVQPPAPQGPNGSWVVSTFCNTVVAHRFTVIAAEGQCPEGTIDGSQWPAETYLNQYDAGERLGLPLAQDGRRGGDSSGPTATMMAVLHALRRDFNGDTPEHQAEFTERVAALGDLGDVYDSVMFSSRIGTTDGSANWVRGPKVAAFVASMGYTNARIERFGTTKNDVLFFNKDKLIQATKDNAAIVSTAFGDAQWGKTGPGRVVVVRGNDAGHPADLMVDDPGGNYFSTRKGPFEWPNGHYGAGSCGKDIPYPMDWIEGYIPGRWIVSLGRPEGSRAPYAPGLRSAKLASTGAAPGGQSTVLLSAKASTAPATFFLQDAEGRKTGFVDGQPVQEIPHSWAAEVNDTETPDGAERALAITRPAAGTTLHVGDGTGGAFAIEESAWHSGKVVAKDTVSVSVGAGGSATPAAPALAAAIDGQAPAGGGGTPDAGGTPSGDGGPTTPGGTITNTNGGITTNNGTTAGSTASIVKAVGARRAVKVTLRCAGTAPCKVSLELTAKRGRKTLVVGTLKTTISGTKTISVKLNAAGRKRLRGRAKLAVKLSAQQDGKAVKGARSVAVRAR